MQLAALLLMKLLLWKYLWLMRRSRAAEGGAWPCTTYVACIWSCCQVLGHNSPILFVSSVADGTAALFTYDVEVGVGAEAAGVLALPTASFSCKGSVLLGAYLLARNKAE